MNSSVICRPPPFPCSFSPPPPPYLSIWPRRSPRMFLEFQFCDSLAQLQCGGGQRKRRKVLRSTGRRLCSQGGFSAVPHREERNFQEREHKSGDGDDKLRHMFSGACTCKCCLGRFCSQIGHLSLSHTFCPQASFSKIFLDFSRNDEQLWMGLV